MFDTSKIIFTKNKDSKKQRLTTVLLLSVIAPTFHQRHS